MNQTKTFPPSPHNDQASTYKGFGLKANEYWALEAANLETLLDAAGFDWKSATDEEIVAAFPRFFRDKGDNESASIMATMRFDRKTKDIGDKGTSPVLFDLTSELARLLNFTGKVATAIRMYSAYNQSGCSHEDAPNDLMWLSDSLHSFGTLGKAIQAGSAENIMFACDMLLNAYRGYQEIRPNSSRQALPTFERNGARFDLNEAISIFTDIRTKVADSTMQKGNE
jgi:hypothetical protein